MIRKATHAGSWYKANAKELDKQLQNWLDHVQVIQSPARAIIGPHAGYSYCGGTAAHAYKQINPNLVKKIFLLGPSHHVHFDDCAISSVDSVSTPFYDIAVNKPIIRELQMTNKFSTLDLETDEDEHSLEMHMPYIAKIMEKHQNNFTLIPILVGSLSFEQEQLYGSIFLPYLKQSDTLFIISSDFCHWGARFRFTYYDEKDGEIWKSIKKLDQMGMNLIEAIDHRGFSNYLTKYKNTICGRHAISILLAAASKLGSGKTSLKFVDYSQSSKCLHKSESSVSYASASLLIN